VEECIGRQVDGVIYNSKRPEERLLDHYRGETAEFVEIDEAAAFCGRSHHLCIRFAGHLRRPCATRLGEAGSVDRKGPLEGAETNPEAFIKGEDMKDLNVIVITGLSGSARARPSMPLRT